MEDSEVRARLTTLEAQVASLRDQLERRDRASTMRQTHRCTVCGHGRVLHFRTIADVGHARLYPFTLQKRRSLWNGGAKDLVAPLEAFVCGACRLVEWHVTTLEGVEIDGDQVVELTAEEPPAPPDDPYR